MCGWSTFQSRAWWQAILVVVIPLVLLVFFILIPCCYHRIFAEHADSEMVNQEHLARTVQRRWRSVGRGSHQIPD
jgi:hypothetical protein